MAPQTADSEQRLEAGPLPRKRGEIGFVDGVHDQLDLQPPPTAFILSPRHPANREGDLEAQIASPTTNIPITPVVPQTSTADAPDAHDTAAKKANRLPTFAGVGLITWSIFILQVLFIVGTIGAWILAAHALNKNSNSGANLGGNTLSIFVHTIFTIGLLVQLVFVERSIYRIRAERYSYLHPGEILPSVRIRGRLPAPIIAFAPWNRPPLPTYAAALAQSGVGTGDVEDHLIAAPPPPAYGNTRGSRLLLQGHMRDSLRAQVQRPDSALSYINVVPPGGPDPMMSYEQFVQALRDGPTEQQSSEVEATRDDVDRDRRRDETLAQLQSSAPSSASVDQHHHQP